MDDVLDHRDAYPEDCSDADLDELTIQMVKAIEAACAKATRIHLDATQQLQVARFEC